MNTTLYELTGELLTLQQMLSDGEATEEELADTIEAVEGEFEYKAQGYGCIVRNLEADISAIKAEEERLAKRRAALSKNKDWLEERMHTVMLALDKKTVKTELFTWGVRNNPPKVVISDEDMIPFEFLNVKTTSAPDKTRIKEFLQSQDGENCEWAHLESDTRITLS